MKKKKSKFRSLFPFSYVSYCFSVCLQMAWVSRSRILVIFMLWMEAYFMVDSWLTVLQSYTESLRTACLLGLLHDVDAPKRLVVIWMHTHAHTWTHIYYVDTYIQVGKKKFILTQKIDGLPSPSCCHYQIFNNGLKVYRSSRWQLNQTRVEEFWFFATKVCKMSCVQKWLDKWKQISIVYHWHLKLNYSLFIRQKL